MASRAPSEVSFPVEKPFLITGLREGPRSPQTPSRASSPRAASPEQGPATNPRSERLLAIHTRTQRLQSELEDLAPTKAALLSQLAAHPAIAPPISRNNSGGSTASSKSVTLSETTTIHSLPSVKAHSELKAPAPASPSEEPDEAEVLAEARAVIKRHIKLLHSYNEIKDAGQGLMGLVADSRGVRLRDLHEELGVGGKD